MRFRTEASVLLRGARVAARTVEKTAVGRMRQVRWGLSAAGWRSWRRCCWRFAGGIILNLMPCVLPVLSLKLMGFAQQAGEDARAVRLHGLAYGAGVLVAFGVLAVLLIGLRAAGEDIGWGFQLQSPLVVAVLAYGLMALGLSFSGVVHFGSSLTAVAGRFGGQDGLGGSFVTGLLAAVVASPCTAPFMGTAVGFALTQPGIVGVAVILCLGLGLALPVLLISMFPSWVRLMPKPGAWMETLKQGVGVSALCNRWRG